MQVIARNDFGTRARLGREAFAAHAGQVQNTGVRAIRASGGNAITGADAGSPAYLYDNAHVSKISSDGPCCGMIIGVEPDGAFGPQTAAATKR